MSRIIGIFIFLGDVLMACFCQGYCSSTNWFSVFGLRAASLLLHGMWAENLHLVI